MKTLRLFLTALIALVLPVAAADEVYAIRLERPVKEGDRFKVAVKVTVESETRTKFEGGEPEEEMIRASCKMLAEFTAVAVTKRGVVSEIRLKIIEAECMEDGERADFFKPGDLVHLRMEDEEYVTDINGEDPEPVQAEILDAFLYVADDDDISEDEMFGTKEKVKVGAEWAMNAEALVEDWTRDGFEGLRAEDVQGSTTLVETTEVGGKPALRLKGKFKLDAKNITVPSLPEGVKAKRHVISISDELESPVDVTALELRLKMEYKSETDGAGKVDDADGTKVNMEIKMRRRFTLELAETPLK